MIKPPPSNPEEHVAFAWDMPTPHPTPTRLSEHQRSFIQSLATNPSGVHARATAAMQKWSTRKAELEPIQRSFHSSLPEDRRATLGEINIFLVMDMLQACNHSDEQYIQDLVVGFPITGNISAGGLGRPVEGGLSVHGKPGRGGAEDVRLLQRKCRELNESTIAHARARITESTEDMTLARQAWDKLQQDIALGRAGKPQKLEELDLDQILLVDTFGVRERHGGSDWKARLINNFKRNRVNEFSWVPAKLQYNGYSDLREAATIFREYSAVALELGKADFKSAFKTLPPSSSQDWRCQSLVFDPRERCHKVVSLQS